MKGRAIAVAAALALAGGVLADIEIRTRTKDGENLAGVHNFRAIVIADSLVTQVEFYVNGDLRDTDESTPYEFSIDTLGEDDGPIEVEFAAYTESGDSAKKKLFVKVYNGISLGLDHHIEAGNDHIANSAWDDAILSGRIAQKIDKESSAARLLLARAFFGKGVLDMAQKYAEDVLTSSADDEGAVALLGAVSLEMAFNPSMAPGAEREDTINTIADSLARAAQSSRTAADRVLAEFGAATDENLLEYAHLHISSGGYSEAIRVLTPKFSNGRGDAEIANALIYAQLRAGRVADAFESMREYKRFGEPDGLGYGLSAIIEQLAGREEESQDDEQEAILNDPTNVAIQHIQIYLAILRRDRSTYGQLIVDLNKSNAESPIAAYYLASVYHLLGQYNESQDTMKSVLLTNPTLYDGFVERGDQVLRFSLSTSLGKEEATHQRSLARAFYKAALEIRPECQTALTGIALSYFADDNLEEGIKYGRASAASAPGYAAGQYLLSAMLLEARQSTAAKTALEAAKAADPGQLAIQTIPSKARAMNYYFRTGRLPLLNLSQAQQD